MSAPASVTPLPDGTARPTDEAEVAEVVAAAPGPMAIQGGGTRLTWPGAPTRRLDVSGLSGIDLYEPGALTIVARAGTPLADVEATLRAEGQRLPFEPPDFRALLGREGTPTLGGIVAANASGPRRVQAGACRDSLIGVRFVDGTGRIVKSGGRVMKNVTGYDLVKLMAGSFGTLGVLTEVAFKVLPAPETTASVMIDGLDDTAAVRAMAQALGSPFEVSGAAHLPAGPEGAPVTLLRLEGFAGSVAYRARELSARLGDAGPVRIEDDPDRARSLWRGIAEVTALAGSADDVWRLSVKASDAPSLVARAAPTAAVYDWGGGLVWLGMPPGTDLRARLGAFGGHARLVRAAPETMAHLPQFQPEAPALAALSAGLRARFDPRGTLNPGLMA